MVTVTGVCTFKEIDFSFLPMGTTSASLEFESNGQTFHGMKVVRDSEADALYYEATDTEILVNTDSFGWDGSEAFQMVDFSGELQSVDDLFGVWLTANTENRSFSYTIDGKYYFNNTLSFPALMPDIRVDFMCGEEPCTWMKFVLDDADYGAYLAYATSTQASVVVYSSKYGWGTAGDKYRYTEFTAQSVTDVFFVWFMTSTEKVAEEEPETPEEVTAYLLRKATLTDIANAIREKRGTTEQIDAADFADEIRAIESGGGGGISVASARIELWQSATSADNEINLGIEVQSASVLFEALPAPTISLDGDTLNIFDESGAAEEFGILVNGEEVAICTVQAPKYNLTIEPQGSTHITISYEKIKLDSAPTSDDDYDYKSDTLEGSITVQASSYWKWSSDFDYDSATETVLTEDTTITISYHTGGSND